MSSFWSVNSSYPSFKQVILLMGVLCFSTVWGQSTPTTNYVERKPASYIPDDDVIVKPIDNELSFYQQYVESDKSEDVLKSRNQLKIWNDNQAFADQYGMDSTLAGSAFFVPTAEEKWEYFKEKYMRYLRRRGEQPIKDMPKTWYQEYRASNEVDTIDQMEARFKESNGQSTGANKTILPESLQAKEVSIWKKTKFIFQPRLDQGLVIVGFRSPVANVRAWVGVNGETEINLQRSVDSIGLRVMFNYFAHSGKYFTSVDQRLMENIYARYTSNKDPQHAVGTPYQDDTLMLLYAKSF